MDIGRWTGKHVSHLRHEIDDGTQASAEGVAPTLSSRRAGLRRFLLNTLLRLGHLLAT